MTTDLHYIRVGHGPDVLMIHGWGSSSQMWTALMAGIAQDFRSWAPDLAGFGGTHVTNDILPDMAMQLSFLERFIDQHHLRPKAVIGHSMGGMLALLLAHARPELMERLVLVCPVVTGRVAFGLQALLATEGWLRFAPRASGLWTAAQWMTRIRWMSAMLTLGDDHIARYLDDFRQAQWHAAAATLSSMVSTTTQPLLPDIHHPTLVVVGTRDLTVPPAEGRLAARLLPHADLVEFPWVFHHPLDERPKAFIPLVRDFLRPVSEP